jgi:HK97 gp10 family phage protein
MAKPSLARFEVQGLQDLLQVLEKLPTNVMQKNVVKRAMTKALEPIRDAAKLAAPYDATRTGGHIYNWGTHLKDSIMISMSLKPSQYPMATGSKYVEMYVGSASPLAHLIEFGTGPRQWKNGKYTGQMTPNPFLRGVWDARKDVVLIVFKREMWSEILKSVKRLARRAEKGTLTKAQIRGLTAGD